MFVSLGCCCGSSGKQGSTGALVTAYFFSAAARTFLQAGVSLSLDLERQAMILPPPGSVPLQYFQ
jgi:hypothetical protein